MKLIFKRVKLRNFFSFGNNETVFDYTSGINLVTGIIDGSVTKNGVGKSTLIVDSISFAIYGKPLRGDHINKDDLVNKTNGKNCVVEVEFMVDNEAYIVTRGIKPNIFSINHNGEEVKFDSIKNTQDWLISKVGISHTCFSNIVVLNVNSSIPFLGMDAVSKRKVIEDIVSLNVYGKMSEELKQQYLDSKADISVIENDIKSKCRTLQVSTESREKLLIQQASFDKEKEEHCNKIKDDIKLLSTSISDQRKLLTDNNHTEEINAIRITIKDIQDKITLLNNKRISVNKDLRDASVNLERLEHETTCPTCTTVLSDSPMAQVFIKSCKTKIEESSLLIKSINEKIERGTEKLSEHNNNIKEIQKSLDRTGVIKSNINNAEIKLKMKEDELTREEKRTLDIGNAISESKITEYKLALTDSEQSLKETNKKYAYAKFLRSILGEDGIRKFVLNNIIPKFNNKINHYLKIMGCDYSLIFDTNLVESIISRNRDVRSYGNFSSGEKKRIDIAILLALMDIAKIQNSVDTNLFVMDEILDTSMDNDGVECFLDYLKNGFKKTYPDKCVYIITHRNDVSSDVYDRMVYLRKIKSFTTIDKIVEFHTD